MTYFYIHISYNIGKCLPTDFGRFVSVPIYTTRVIHDVRYKHFFFCQRVKNSLIVLSYIRYDYVILCELWRAYCNIIIIIIKMILK